MLFKERRTRDDPIKAPWTVSVSQFPGEDACPELDVLDKLIRKTRGHSPDPMLEEWKKKIVWPARTEYGPPLFMTLLQISEKMRLWFQLLDSLKDCVVIDVFRCPEEILNSTKNDQLED